MPPDIFTWIGGIIVSVLGFFLKSTYDRQAALEQKYNDLHDIYVKQHDFKEFKTELWRRLDELADLHKK